MSTEGHDVDLQCMTLSKDTQVKQWGWTYI